MWSNWLYSLKYGLFGCRIRIWRSSGGGLWRIRGIIRVDRKNRIIEDWVWIRPVRTIWSAAIVIYGTYSAIVNRHPIDSLEKRNKQSRFWLQINCYFMLLKVLLLKLRWPLKRQQIEKVSCFCANVHKPLPINSFQCAHFTHIYIEYRGRWQLWRWRCDDRTYLINFNTKQPYRHIEMYLVSSGSFYRLSGASGFHTKFTQHSHFETMDFDESVFIVERRAIFSCEIQQWMYKLVFIYMHVKA